MNQAARIVARTTTTSKGQTTIPKSIRDALGIADGTPLDWELADGKLTVAPRTHRLVDLAGILGDPLGRPVTVDEMHKAVLDEAAERFRRTRG
jgi:AbrB family looped-hinge helix DNA binding protein